MNQSFRNNDGYSLVEVMVAMVGLSLVFLLLTSIITTSIKTSSVARDADYALMAARAKMSELTSPDNVIIERNSTGSDDYSAPNGLKYVREWAIGDGNPVPVNVKAWAKPPSPNDEPSDIVSIFGYIDPGKICDDDAPQPQNKIIITKPGNNPTTPDYYGNVTLSYPIDPTIQNIISNEMELCKFGVSPADAALIKDFVLAGEDAASFRIVDKDKIKLSQELIINPAASPIQLVFTIEGRNCRDEAGNSQIQVTVIFEENIGLPEIYFTPAKNPFYELKEPAEPGGTNAEEWSINDKVGEVYFSAGNSTGASFNVNVLNETPNIFGHAPNANGGYDIFFNADPQVNFENFQKYDFHFTLIRDDESKEAEYTINIEEVNKAPTNISFFPTEGREPTDIGIYVGKIIAENDDNGFVLGEIHLSDPNIATEFRQSTVSIVNGSSYFGIDGQGVIEKNDGSGWLFMGNPQDYMQVVLKTEISESFIGSPLQLQINLENEQPLTDGTGTFILTKILSFEVVEDQSSDPCNDIDTYVSGVQYCAGNKVKHNNYIWIAKYCTTNEPYQQDWGPWDMGEACGVKPKNLTPTDFEYQGDAGVRTPVTGPYKVGSFPYNKIVDAEAQANGTYTFELVGISKFEVLNGNELWLKNGEAIPLSIVEVPCTIRVKLNDGMAERGNRYVEKDIHFEINKGNKTPTAILFTPDPAFNQTAPITAGNSPMKMGTFSCTDVDSALSEYVYTRSGADAAKFEIIGDGLYLKANETLEGNYVYVITVRVTDLQSTEIPNYFEQASFKFRVKWTPCVNPVGTPTIDGQPSKSVVEGTTYIGQLGGVTHPTATVYWEIGSGNDANLFSISSAGALSAKSSTLQPGTYSVPVIAAITCPDGTPNEIPGTVQVQVQNVPCEISSVNYLPQNKTFPDIIKGNTVVGTFFAYPSPGSSGNITYSIQHVSGTSGQISINSTNGNITISSNAPAGTYVFDIIANMQCTQNTSAISVNFGGFQVKVIECSLTGSITAGQSFEATNVGLKTHLVVHNVVEPTGTTINWNVISNGGLSGVSRGSATDTTVELKVPQGATPGTYTVTLQASACSPAVTVSGSVSVTVTQTCKISGTPSFASGHIFQVTEGTTNVGTLSGLSGEGFKWEQRSGTPNVQVNNNGSITISPSLGIGTYSFSVEPTACGETQRRPVMNYSVQVKSASWCDGIDDWVNGKSYVFASVVKYTNGNVYVMSNVNNAPTTQNPTGGFWTLIGACGNPVNCGSFSSTNSGSSAGSILYYSNALYIANAWINSGIYPPHNNWVPIVGINCGGSTPPVTTYDITASVSGGNGTILPSGTVTKNSGENQTFTFTPNAGYEIDQILVDGASVSVAGTYTFSNIISNHTIVVSFRSSGGGGGNPCDAIPDWTSGAVVVNALVKYNNNVYIGYPAGGWDGGTAPGSNSAWRSIDSCANLVTANNWSGGCSKWTKVNYNGYIYINVGEWNTSTPGGTTVGGIVNNWMCLAVAQ